MPRLSSSPWPELFGHDENRQGLGQSVTPVQTVPLSRSLRYRGTEEHCKARKAVLEVGIPGTKRYGGAISLSCPSGRARRSSAAVQILRTLTAMARSPYSIRGPTAAREHGRSGDDRAHIIRAADGPRISCRQSVLASAHMGMTPSSPSAAS